jgi:C-terminal processing protease CtpA/Prc
MDGVSAGDVILSCSTGDASGRRLVTLARDKVETVDVAVVRYDQAMGTIDAKLFMQSHRIDQIVKGGNADHAGLAIGDEVVAVDGRSIADLDGDAVMAVITLRPAGTPVALTIARGATTRTVNVIVRAADN